jgi:hypothetical protein
MRRYRGPTSSTPATTVPLEPAPATEEFPPRFKFKRSAYVMTPAPSASTVEAEYDKYVSTTSAKGTDILQFWEVNTPIIN